MKHEPSPEIPAKRHARILDIQPSEDGRVKFRIDENATGRDLLATLAYLEPNKATIDSQLDIIMEHGLLNNKNGNLLKHRRVAIDDFTILKTAQAKIERIVVFGDNPTIEDVKQTLATIYGSKELGDDKTRALTLELVDMGLLAGLLIRTGHKNEIATSTDAQMADEMLRLTEEFYGTNEPPIIE